MQHLVCAAGSKEKPASSSSRKGPVASYLALCAVCQASAVCTMCKRPRHLRAYSNAATCHIHSTVDATQQLQCKKTHMQPAVAQQKSADVYAVLGLQVYP